MPEKEYIEREAIPLKKFIKTAQMFSDDIICAIGTDFMENIAESENKELFEIIKAIQEAPTADVAEVKHGKWLYVSGVGRYAEYECSECKAHVCFDEKIDGTIPVYNGCPHCLAKMDGKEKKDA